MLVYDICSIDYTEMNYQVKLLCIGSSDIFPIETIMMIITDVPPRLHCRPIIMNKCWILLGVIWISEWTLKMYPVTAGHWISVNRILFHAVLLAFLLVLFKQTGWCWSAASEQFTSSSGHFLLETQTPLQGKRASFSLHVHLTRLDLFSWTASQPDCLSALIQLLIWWLRLLSLRRYFGSACRRCPPAENPAR